MNDIPRSPKKSRRQQALFVLCAAVFMYFAGWALYHSFKLEICDVVVRQVRGTQYQHQGYTWALRRCGDQFERDLANGLIRPGDLVSDVSARHPPVRIETYSRYTYSLYYPPGRYNGGPQILAKDGVVVMAATGGCWCHIFFDTLSASESKELANLIEAKFAAKEAAERTARMAVAGPAATIDPWNLPPPANEPGN